MCKHMLLILTYLLIPQLKCDQNLISPNNSHEFQAISTCIIKIVNIYFDTPFIVYVDNNEKNDLSNIILKQLHFVIRLSNTNIENNNLNPNYILIASNNDNLIGHLDKLKGNWDWHPAAKFIIVMNQIEEWYHLRKTVTMLWEALVENFVILYYSPEKFGKLTLFTSSYYNMSSKCGTEPNLNNIGSCDENLKDLIFIKQASKDFLTNCTFNVVTVQCEPIVVNVTLLKHPGAGVVFIREIAEAANLKIRFLPTKALQIGSEAVTEYLIFQMRNLQTAGYMTCSGSSRVSLPINYVESYYLISDQLIWVIPIPKAFARWKNIAFVFEWQCWASIFLTLIVMSLFLWFFYSHKLKMSFFNVLLKQFQTLMGLPTRYFPKLIMLRLLFLMWLISSIHLDSAFQGKLMSILTQPHTASKIASVDELRKSNINIIAPSYVYRALDETLKNRSIISRNARSRDDLKEVIRSGNLATVVTGLTFYYYFDQTLDPRSGRPRFYTLNQPFLSYHLSLLYQKGHPIADIFDTYTLLLHQNGIFHKRYFEMRNSALKAQQRNSGLTDTKPLSFWHLEVAFFLLGLGTLVSFLVLIWEIIFYIEKNKIFENRRHR